MRLQFGLVTQEGALGRVNSAKLNKDLEGYVVIVAGLLSVAFHKSKKMMKAYMYLVIVSLPIVEKHILIIKLDLAPWQLPTAYHPSYKHIIDIEQG